MKSSPDATPIGTGHVPGCDDTGGNPEPGSTHSVIRFDEAVVADHGDKYQLFVDADLDQKRAGSLVAAFEQ